MPARHERTTAFTVLAALTLGACGGSNGDDPATFDTLQSDFDALWGTYGDPAYPVTTDAEMPVTGSATYQGAAVFSDTLTNINNIIANPSSVSRATITADFAGDQVGGRFYEFRASNPNVDMSGELQLVNGTINSNLFGADITGALTIDGTVVSYTGGDVVGNFLGSQAGAVSALILQGNSSTQYNGALVADR